MVRTVAPWARTILLLGAGTAGLGAGAGLGVRFAQKTGLSWPTALRVLLLVLGLAALVLGVRSSWRGLRGWRRLVLLPVVVVLLLAASSTGLAVAYTQVPPTALGARTPGDHDLSFEDVSMTAGDGTRLSAWLIPPRNGAAVVLLHGAGSTRTSVLAQAAVLGRNGFGVLMPDARGHGRSGGRGMDLGWYGDADVAAAMSFLQGELDLPLSRIGLVGMSMGGEEAIGAAPRTGVLAVVAEGATGRTAQDKDQWLPGGVTGAVQRALDKLTYSLTSLLTSATRPTALHVAVREASAARFLLVTAGRVPDESRAAAVLHRAAADRVEVWSVPGAGHTGGSTTDPVGWEERVVGFLTRELT